MWTALFERLQIDRALRRTCGWERRSDVPSEATFSRAFAEFAAQNLPEQLHEQLVRRHLRDHIIGYILRDATEIETREKPCRRSPDDLPPPAPPKRKRGRPRRDEVLPPKPLTRIEQQRTQSLDEMRAGGTAASSGVMQLRRPVGASRWLVGISVQS
jgi:MoxR-like ATPase